MDHPLPYIPPPDYTVRQPSAQAYLAQQQAQQYHNSRDDHGQPHHYVPPVGATAPDRFGPGALGPDI